MYLCALLYTNIRFFFNAIFIFVSILYVHNRTCNQDSELSTDEEEVMLISCPNIQNSLPYSLYHSNR